MLKSLSWTVRLSSAVVALTATLSASAPAFAEFAVVDSLLDHGQRLAAMPELHTTYPKLPSFGDGEIFMIFAHADDELTILPQIAYYRERFPNRPIHWILVSDSGSGKTLPWTCWFQSTADCRYHEAAKVAACVGIEEPQTMGLHDGTLDQEKNLGAKIWKKINAVRNGPVAAIFSSDNTGLYGHPDHVAVHDAVAPLARAHGIPFVSVALPEYFKQIIPIRPAFQDRKKPSITHEIKLDADLQEKMVCAHGAHKSQEILLWVMDQTLSATEFYSIANKSFFNLTPN